MSLQGKVALVTGASRGIGQAIALELGRQGAVVIGTATSASGAERIAATLKENGVQGTGLELNVTSDESVAAVLAEITAQFGAPAILVNNAGVSLKNEQGHSNTAQNTSEAEFNQTMRINALAPLLLTQQFLPGMRQASYGRIVNVASLAGRSKTAVSGPAYMMSKAALMAWSRAVALEMAPYGVVCNSVAPGRVLTKMAMQGGDEVNQRIAQTTPTGRIGTPDEVAYAIAMLCTPEAAFTTGACLDINGGVFMS